MKVLHLNLKKDWFNLIKSGVKKREYRKITPYWTKRIEGKEYDEIWIKMGYPKNTESDKIIKFPYRGYYKLECPHPDTLSVHMNYVFPLQMNDDEQ